MSLLSLTYVAALQRSVFVARQHNGIDVVRPVPRQLRRISLNVVALQRRYAADDVYRTPDKCMMLLWPTVIAVVVAVGALPKLECNSNCNHC